LWNAIACCLEEILEEHHAYIIFHSEDGGSIFHETGVKREPVYSSESVYFYQTLQCYIPEDGNLQAYYFQLNTN
jgi:hypothetical protein